MSQSKLVRCCKRFRCGCACVHKRRLRPPAVRVAGPPGRQLGRHSSGLRRSSGAAAHCRRRRCRGATAGRWLPWTHSQTCAVRTCRSGSASRGGATGGCAGRTLPGQQLRRPSRVLQPRVMAPRTWTMSRAEPLSRQPVRGRGGGAAAGAPRGAACHAPTASRRPDAPQACMPGPVTIFRRSLQRSG